MHTIKHSECLALKRVRMKSYQIRKDNIKEVRDKMGYYYRKEELNKDYENDKLDKTEWKCYSPKTY